MSNKNGHRYEFGDFRLDSEPPSLWRDESLVALPPKALEMLLLLVRRRDIIVSREELLDTVWRDTFVEEGNINYTVSLLRKTLDKDDKGRFIQTVPKRGYRFVADVLEVSANGHAENAVPECRSCDSNRTTKTEDSLALYRNSFARPALCHGFCDLAEFGRGKKLSTHRRYEQKYPHGRSPASEDVGGKRGQQIIVARLDRFTDFTSRQFEPLFGAPAEFRQRLCRSRSGPAKVWRNIKG